ncbi:MAG: hypothetical protein ACQCXQ_05180, partial [Verrucomicrobiales bacterium]
YCRQGEFLVVRDWAVLPDVCLLSNEPTGVGSWRKRKRFIWVPQWIYLLILVHVFVMLLVHVFVQKKVRLTYSMSRRTRRRILGRQLGATTLVLTGVAGIFAALMNVPDPDLLVAAAVVCSVMVVAGLLVAMRANPLRVKRHENGWFYLKGCSPEFLDGLDGRLG